MLALRVWWLRLSHLLVGEPDAPEIVLFYALAAGLGGGRRASRRRGRHEGQVGVRVVACRTGGGPVRRDGRCLQRGRQAVATAWKEDSVRPSFDVKPESLNNNANLLVELRACLAPDAPTRNSPTGGLRTRVARGTRANT
jgi:hypothetical protein